MIFGLVIVGDRWPVSRVGHDRHRSTTDRVRNFLKGVCSCECVFVWVCVCVCSPFNRFQWRLEWCLTYVWTYQAAVNIFRSIEMIASLSPKNSETDWQTGWLPANRIVQGMVRAVLQSVLGKHILLIMIFRVDKMSPPAIVGDRWSLATLQCCNVARMSQPPCCVLVEQHFLLVFHYTFSLFILFFIFCTDHFLCLIAGSAF